MGDLRHPRIGPRLPLLVALAVASGALQAARGDQGGIEGSYRQAGRAAATLEVRPAAQGWVARLEGGAAPDDGAGASADCVVEARGTLRDGVLEARFAPVEAPAFSYTADQAEREARRLRIVFGPGSAQVVEADTFGYCGFAANLTGSYRQVAPPSR